MINQNTYIHLGQVKDNIMDTSFLTNTQCAITFKRDDGSVVILVASYFPDPRTIKSLVSQFGFYALVRHPEREVQVLTPENGSKSLNGLSVDEYIKHGRVGLMSAVRPHELFKVSDKLKKQLLTN